MTYYVDTNYFLRFFLNDNKEQTKKVAKLFLSSSRGEIKLISSVVVFLELYWVLKSFYNFPKSKIIESLKAVLQMDFIKFEEEQIMVLALEVFQKHNLDLEDCFHLAYSKEAANTTAKTCKLATFDKKLRTVERSI